MNGTSKIQGCVRFTIFDSLYWIYFDIYRDINGNEYMHILVILSELKRLYASTE